MLTVQREYGMPKCPKVRKMHVQRSRSSVGLGCDLLRSRMQKRAVDDRSILLSSRTPRNAGQVCSRRFGRVIYATLAYRLRSVIWWKQYALRYGSRNKRVPLTAFIYGRIQCAAENTMWHSITILNYTLSNPINRINLRIMPW